MLAPGVRAKGRGVVEAREAYQLREPQVSHPGNYDLENDDFEVETPIYVIFIDRYQYHNFA